MAWLRGSAPSIRSGRANSFKAEAVCIRLAADRDDHDIGLQRFRRAALGRFDIHFQLGLGLLDAGDLGAELEGEALFLEGPLGFLGDFGVGRRQDAVEILDDGHFRAEPRPDRAHLEPDHAGADQHQFLRHGLQAEGADIGDNALLVDLDAGQGGGPVLVRTLKRWPLIRAVEARLTGPILQRVMLPKLKGIPGLIGVTRA